MIWKIVAGLGMLYCFVYFGIALLAYGGDIAQKKARLSEFIVQIVPPLLVLVLGGHVLGWY
jgi:hypothetical protein